MHTDALELVKKEIAKLMEIPANSLDADTALADLGMDSLEGLELVVAIEEVFNVQLAEDDPARFKTLQSIVDVLNERLMQAAAA